MEVPVGQPARQGPVILRCGRAQKQAQRKDSISVALCHRQQVFINVQPHGILPLAAVFGVGECVVEFQQGQRRQSRIDDVHVWLIPAHPEASNLALVGQVRRILAAEQVAPEKHGVVPVLGVLGGTEQLAGSERPPGAVLG